jgi:uncharacterized protein (TIGR02466 family)
MNYYDSVKEDIIFPSFIRSCVPMINLEDIKSECYDMEKKYSTRKCSNLGGYQSPAINSTTEYEQMNRLSSVTKQFAQNTIDKHNLHVKVDSMLWWMNINRQSDYNLLHTHHRADLIGIYYIEIPSGDLSIVRNDGSQYSNLYAKQNEMLTMNLRGEPGRIYLLPGHLWHYVKPNKLSQDRISISFNIYVL